MYVSVYAIYYRIQSKEDEPCLCAGEFWIFGKKWGFEQHSLCEVLPDLSTTSPQFSLIAMALLTPA